MEEQGKPPEPTPANAETNQEPPEKDRVYPPAGETNQTGEGINVREDLVFFGDPKYAFCKTMNCVVNVETRKEVDDPTFLLRAQDSLALSSVKHYRGRCEAAQLLGHAQKVGERINEMKDWREENADRVKEPD